MPLTYLRLWVGEYYSPPRIVKNLGPIMKNNNYPPQYYFESHPFNTRARNNKTADMRKPRIVSGILLTNHKSKRDNQIHGRVKKIFVISKQDIDDTIDYTNYTEKYHPILHTTLINIRQMTIKRAGDVKYTNNSRNSSITHPRPAPPLLPSNLTIKDSGRRIKWAKCEEHSEHAPQNKLGKYIMTLVNPKRKPYP